MFIALTVINFSASEERNVGLFVWFNHSGRAFRS